jgi:hypothetical protein
MTVQALVDLARSLEKEAQRKLVLSQRPKLFDEPMSKDLQASYVQQAADRENESQAIRRFLVRNVTRDLICLVGIRVVTLTVGNNNPEIVASWVTGLEKPTLEQEQILWDTWNVCEVLHPIMPKESLTSWMLGMNPDLDDEAPAVLLKSEPDRVLQVAKAFLE